LLLELVELPSRQSARIALVLEGAQRIEALFPEQGQPVMDSPRADSEQLGDFLSGIVLVQPQQGRQTLVKPHVFRFAAAFFNNQSEYG
jgi:hypothetical protein